MKKGGSRGSGCGPRVPPAALQEVRPPQPRLSTSPTGPGRRNIDLRFASTKVAGCYCGDWGWGRQGGFGGAVCGACAWRERGQVHVFGVASCG